VKIIFCDSTLQQKEISKEIGKKYIFKPAIGRGEIVNLLEKNANTVSEIIIVDGVFDQSPSITHKEILLAIYKGIKVVGISSMGALRASELYSYGMKGFGKIFEKYKSGEIELDDEVAVSYAQRNNKFYKTIPLVNIRETVEYHNLPREILAESRKVFYKERTWSNLKSVLSEVDYENLYEKYIDLKKQDVLEFLESNHTSSFPVNKQKNFVNSIYLSNQLEKHKERNIVDFINQNLLKKQINQHSHGSSKTKYKKTASFLGVNRKFAATIQTVIEVNLKGIVVNQYLILKFKKNILENLNLKSKEQLHEYLLSKDISILDLDTIFSCIYLLYKFYFFKVYSSIDSNDAIY
jgi:hypothetical protein